MKIRICKRDGWWKIYFVYFPYEVREYYNFIERTKTWEQAMEFAQMMVKCGF